MHSYDFTFILALFVPVLLPALFIGRYLYRVMEGEKTWLSPVLQPVERLCYRIAGVDSKREQERKNYSLALLAFTLVSLLTLFTILMLQGSLPLNPQQLPGLEWTLAFNTAVSFATNTNWQAYSGEAQMSYFSQMVGLGVQNFVSTAVGLAVLVVFCRGIARRSSNSVGNFWVDLTRATLYGLLPALPSAGLAGRATSLPRRCDCTHHCWHRSGCATGACSQPDSDQATGPKRVLAIVCARHCERPFAFWRRARRPSGACIDCANN